MSNRLSPHESEDTDVILLGHSLGGILAAEVALLPSAPGSKEIFEHRILGLINFDVPFLGLHPRVISTGIGNLLHPKRKNSPSPQRKRDPSPPADPSETVSSRLGSIDLDDHPCSDPFAVPSNDPHFDPAFPNDVHLARRGQLDGALHFIKKNSDHLASAIQDYFKSYFEFGGCLLDYAGLHSRYRRLRELEAVNELERKRDAQGRLLRRIRFVNYYTASTGRIKSRSPSPMRVPESDTQQTRSISGTSVGKEIINEQARSRQSSPRPYVEGPQEGSKHDLDGYDASGAQSEESENPHIPTLEDDVNPHENNPTAAIESLPPLPPLPDEPSAFDPSRYHDKDTLKLAQKEHSRLVKAYERAKKDRDKAIKDREELARKLAKAAAKKQLQEQKKAAAAKQGEKASANNKDSDIVVIVQEEEETSSSSSSIDERPPSSRDLNNSNISLLTNNTTTTGRGSEDHDTAILSSSPQPSAPPPPPPPPLPPRPQQKQSPKQKPSKKDRKFCALPPAVESDPLWERVFMEGIDEVVAHQSMFLPNGSYYERLVGDTAARIEEWVKDDCTRRVIWRSQVEDGVLG